MTDLNDFRLIIDAIYYRSGDFLKLRTWDKDFVVVNYEPDGEPFKMRRVDFEGRYILADKECNETQI